MIQKVFLILFLLFGCTFAADLNSSKKSIDEQLLLLSYESAPKRVYVDQIFKIKLKTIVAVSDFDKIKSFFLDAKNIKVLNPNAPWKWYNDNIYFNEYYVKVLSSDAVFPRIKVGVFKSAELVASSSIKPLKSEIIELKSSAIFSHVLAEYLKVVKTKTTKFDKQSNILVMEIEGRYANLKEFKVDNAIKQGIDSYSVKLPFVKIYYYAILPKSQSEFIFSYFNTKLNSFEKIRIPVQVEEEDTSTQLELNPKESKLSVYKNIALVAIAFLSLIIWFFRRKIVYILIFVVIVIYLLLFYNPFDTIILSKGTKIRILPTYNSTIFYVTDRKIIAEKLGSVKKYIKVLLPNGKIGWIKEKDE